MWSGSSLKMPGTNRCPQPSAAQHLQNPWGHPAALFLGLALDLCDESAREGTEHPCSLHPLLHSELPCRGSSVPFGLVNPQKSLAKGIFSSPVRGIHRDRFPLAQ